MCIINYKKYLRLEVIWRDDDMIELQVLGSNGRYSGITEVYDVKDNLLDFAMKLDGFPRANEVLFLSIGAKYGSSYFGLKLYQFDPTGKIAVKVVLEDNKSTSYGEPQKNKVSLELIVEPASIDTFQKYLKTLAEREEGFAELIGI